MDFGIIYQLRTKKFWWLDAIFYFVIALLLATIICFVIFTLKISFQEKKLKEIENKIAISTGTAQQKEEEKKVFDYQKKINDFTPLLNAHKNPTNVFKFLEQITLPNIWFSSFLMGAQTGKIQVSGEAEGTTALSRQISILEQNEAVKGLENFTADPTETGRIRFNFGLILDPGIFFAVSAGEAQPEEILETITPSSSLFLNENIFASPR